MLKTVIVLSVQLLLATAVGPLPAQEPVENPEAAGDSGAAEVGDSVGDRRAAEAGDVVGDAGRVGEPAGPGSVEQASYGVPVFPGAEPRPDVARAVEAYYAPAAGEQHALIGVFDTPAEFEDIYEFYGRRMDPGKRGWRRKSHPLEHQTRTLGQFRSQLVAQSGLEGALPVVLEPLFGDPEWSQEEFDARLQKLAAENPGAEIEFAEGVRRISGDPDGSVVRITVSRPYIDPESMALVPETRIVLMKITPVKSPPGS